MGILERWRFQTKASKPYLYLHGNICIERACQKLQPNKNSSEVKSESFIVVSNERVK